MLGVTSQWGAGHAEQHKLHYELLKLSSVTFYMFG